MLGSSVFLLGLPLGLIYSVRAVGRAGDRGFAWAGLVLSIVAWTIVGIALFVKLA
jgi:hypothetical protein